MGHITGQRLCGWIGIHVSLSVAYRVLHTSKTLDSKDEASCRYQLNFTFNEGVVLDKGTKGQLTKGKPLFYQQPGLFLCFAGCPTTGMKPNPCTGNLFC